MNVLRISHLSTCFVVLHHTHFFDTRLSPYILLTPDNRRCVAKTFLLIPNDMIKPKHVLYDWDSASSSSKTHSSLKGRALLKISRCRSSNGREASRQANNETKTAHWRQQEEQFHCGLCLDWVKRGPFWDARDNLWRYPDHTNRHRCIDNANTRRLWSSAKKCQGAACALCEKRAKALCEKRAKGTK